MDTRKAPREPTNRGINREESEEGPRELEEERYPAIETGGGVMILDMENCNNGWIQSDSPVRTDTWV